MRMRKSDAPPAIIQKVRAICMALDDVVEELAWAGTRWVTRKRNFAHVLVVKDRWPPQYARAAGRDGVVLTFRAAGPLYDALAEAGAPFFAPPWGVRWTSHVVGMHLGRGVDWALVKRCIVDSHALLARKKSKSARPSSKKASRAKRSPPKGSAPPKKSRSRGRRRGQ